MMIFTLDFVPFDPDHYAGPIVRVRLGVVTSPDCLSMGELRGWIDLMKQNLDELVIDAESKFALEWRRRERTTKGRQAAE